jgi:hypothetical protein
MIKLIHTHDWILPSKDLRSQALQNCPVSIILIKQLQIRTGHFRKLGVLRLPLVLMLVMKSGLLHLQFQH